MTRYSRQIAVEGFGPQGQARLQAASVLVIGAGGVAAPVLQYLVGAGVGHVRVVDPDIVDLSNLHRQTLFRMADIGKPKARVAAEAMTLLNPDTKITALQHAFDPANAAQLSDGMDLILDCADSFAASYIASDLCLVTGQPLISASIVGRSGYAGGFCGGVAPGLRAIFPDLPDQLGSCANDGVLGPSVGVVGAVQAEMAIAVLTGASPSPLGQLVTYDADGTRFGGFRFDAATDPMPKPAFIAATDVRPDDFLIDLRAVDEAGPALPQPAIRHSVDSFAPGGPTPKTDQRAVLACRSGLRAWRAAQRLSTYWTGEVKLIALGDRPGDSPGNTQGDTP